MSSSSNKIEEEQFEVADDDADLLIPKVIVECPKQRIKKSIVDPSKNPKRYISRLFLTYSCKKLENGYELILKGERVFKKLGRRLDDIDVRHIMDHVEGEGDIISLDLANNVITDMGFDILCESMLESNLINLNLRNNELRDLSEDACRRLGEITCLRRLNLSGNHLTQKSADLLKSALTVNKSLEILEVAGVDYYVHCVERITDALIYFNDTIKVLNISRILGIPRYRLRSYHLANMIYSVLTRNSTLVEIHMEKNGISDHDVEKMVEGLKINNTLVLLNLTANFISNIGLEKIANILPGSNLQVLLLRSNTIGDHGAIALSKVMPLSKLLHLDLAHNRIGDIGIANLLWTIKKTTALYTFYIFGNNFTKQTLEIINIQMLRGKIIPDSLDIVLYWEEDGTLRCSYNPVADEYRNQMFGTYDGSHVIKKQNLLAYPTVDIFRPSKFKYLVDYPKGYDPKILSHYKDHITVK